MDALPPQPPAIVTTNNQAEQSRYRVRDGDRELLVSIQGKVAFRGDADLEFGPAGFLRMEAVAPAQRLVIQWNATACRISGDRNGSCSDTDRRTVVRLLKQQPSTPIPPPHKA